MNKKLIVIIGSAVLLIILVVILINPFKKSPKPVAPPPPPQVEDTLVKLTKVLHSYRSEERAKAVSDLATVSDKSKAMASLIEALKDENVKVREEAVKTLGILNKPEAIKPLEEMLKDPDVYLPVYAAESLAKLGNFSGKAVAVKALDEINVSDIKKSAINAITLSKDIKLIPKIKKFISDKDVNVQQTAKNTVAALERIKEEEKKKEIELRKKQEALKKAQDAFQLDMVYYKKESKKKTFSTDDRIVLLERIAKKYKDTAIDINELKTELTNQLKLKNEQKLKIKQNSPKAQGVQSKTNPMSKEQQSQVKPKSSTKESSSVKNSAK